MSTGQRRPRPAPGGTPPARRCRRGGRRRGWPGGASPGRWRPARSAPSAAWMHPEALPAQVEVDQVGDVGVVLDHHDRAQVRCSRPASLAPRCDRSVRALRVRHSSVGCSFDMATYLDRILAAHRAAAAADGRDLDELIAAAGGSGAGAPVRAAAGRVEPPARTGSGVAVIAEIKRRSPSKGDLGARPGRRRAGQGLADGGAACLSVLTDSGVLRRVGRGPGRGAAAASALPVLRKDFTVVRGRRVRRPAHGRRRRAADRGRPFRRPSWPRLAGAGRRARPRRPGRGARRSRAGRRALGAGATADRGQPAGPGHLRGGHPPGRAGGRRPCPPEWSGWPSPASRSRRRPPAAPTPASTPSWSASRSCAPADPRRRRRRPAGGLQCS